MTPSPAQRHQLVLRDLFVGLHRYLEPLEHLAQIFFAPADIIWSEEDYVQPDLFVVPADQVTGDWRDCRTLLLAVEVVSPSSAHAARVTKRRLCQERGVATYWLVDPDAQLAEVWRPGEPRSVFPRLAFPVLALDGLLDALGVGFARVVALADGNQCRSFDGRVRSRPRPRRRGP